MEDKKWALEIELRKAELEKSSEKKDQLFGELGDMAKAMLAGIAEERAKVSGQPPMAPLAPQQYVPPQPPPTLYYHSPPPRCIIRVAGVMTIGGTQI